MKDNLKDGFGIFHYHRHHTRDFEKYEGFWKDDLKNGLGKLTFKNGEILQGIWIEG
jgi:hypothetical protein